MADNVVEITVPLGNRLQEMRAKAPGAKDMSDAQFAIAAHQHYYSDMPMVDFLDKMGLDRADVLYELRGDDDIYGSYLRESLAAPGTNESPEDAAKRHGGAIDERRAGTGEGAARAVLQGATFGFGDELVAAGTAALTPGPESFGEKFNAVQARESGLVENFREDNPVVAYGAEIAGAIPTSVVGGGQLVGRGANAFLRGASSGAVGASQGAVYGAGATDGDLEQRGAGAASGAFLGGAAGVAVPAVVGAVRNTVASPTKAAVAAAPDAAAIKAQGSAGYEAAKTAGVQVRPEASSLLAQDFRALLKHEGMVLPNGKLSSGTGRIKKAMSELDQFTSSPMDMAQFQTLRETVQEIARSPKGKQAQVGRKMLEQLDEFADSLPDDAFAGTGGPEAVTKWQAAKADWARGKRTEAIEDALYNARLAQSGDYGSRLRTQFGSILKKHRKRSQGFSDAEVKAMEKFVDGGPLNDMMKAFSQGGGLPSSIAGGVAAGPAGAAAGAGLSLGSRMWLNNSAKGAANMLRAEVATPGGLQVVKGPPNHLTRLGTASSFPLMDEPRNALSSLLAPAL